jgi:hypothetical protein
MIHWQDVENYDVSGVTIALLPLERAFLLMLTADYFASLRHNIADYEDNIDVIEEIAAELENKL